MTVEDIYLAFGEASFTNDIDSDLTAAGTDVRVALLESAYTPDFENHSTWSDISANEISGGDADGYDSPGELLTNKSLDTSGRLARLDADNVEWADSTITASYAVIYHAEPADAADQDLIMLIDFEGEESSQDASFSINWDADGLLEVDTNPA